MLIREKRLEEMKARFRLDGAFTDRLPATGDKNYNVSCLYVEGLSVIAKQ